MVKKLESFYIGKAKELFTTDNEDFYIAKFLNQVAANKGKRIEDREGKGVLTNAISALIFRYLEDHGIKTHFVEKVSDEEMLVKKIEMIPMEVVLRNYTAGWLVYRFKMERGQKIDPAIIEYYYKDDEINDPFLNTDHARYLGLASREELHEIREITHLVNGLLLDLFWEAKTTLVDFKLEFGRNDQGELVIGDEISPDVCRLWDSATGASLDIDLFRRNEGDVVAAYDVIYNRLLKAL